MGWVRARHGQGRTHFVLLMHGTAGKRATTRQSGLLQYIFAVTSVTEYSRGGNIWRSEDRGVSWTDITDQLSGTRAGKLSCQVELPRVYLTFIYIYVCLRLLAAGAQGSGQRYFRRPASLSSYIHA